MWFVCNGVAVHAVSRAPLNKALAVTPMSPEQFATLQSEIWQIKIAVIVTGIAIILICALAAVRMYFSVKRYVTRRLDDLFREEANDLIEKGDTTSLKTLALGKLKERPNHADAHWYLGRALYMEKDWSAALAEFEATRSLMPNWDVEHVSPFVAEIKARQAAATPEA